MVIIRAKYLIPDSKNCIESGAVVVNDSTITHVGTFNEIKSICKVEKIIDLGNAIILPGLINLHTHLDLTNLHNLIKPTNRFTHWVYQIVCARIRWKNEDYISSIEKGISLSIESGTTTVADITNTGHSFYVLKKSPLRKIIYKEVIDLNPEHANEVINKNLSELSNIETDALLLKGISPHAPYSVSKELYKAVAQTAKEMNIPVCTHIAETQDEIEFLTKGTGDFPALLRQLRALPDKWQPPEITPIKYLNDTGFLNNQPLLIHCNYITDEEIPLIKLSGASVVFCPRSHRFFGHKQHPLLKLLDANLNVGLGTDSLASNDSLSILDEMKYLFHHYSILPRTIISMATINGAKALGMEKQVGQISKGFKADICGIKLQGNKTVDIYKRLFDTSSENIFTMINGVICYNMTCH